MNLSDAITSYPSSNLKKAPTGYASSPIGSSAEIKKRSRIIDLVLKDVSNKEQREIFRRIGLLDVAMEKASIKNAANYYRRWLFGTNLKEGFTFDGTKMKYLVLESGIVNRSESYKAAKSKLDTKILEFISSRPPKLSELASKAVSRSHKRGFRLPKDADVKVDLPGFTDLSMPLQYLGPNLTEDVSMQNVMLIDAGIIDPDPTIIEIIGGMLSAYTQFKESGGLRKVRSFPEMAAIVGSFRLYGYFTGSVSKSSADNKWYMYPTYFGTRLIDRYAFSGDNEDEDQALGYWHPDYGHSVSKAGPMLRNGMFVDFRRKFRDMYNSRKEIDQPDMKCDPYALVQEMQKVPVKDILPIEIQNLNVSF